MTSKTLSFLLSLLFGQIVGIDAAIHMVVCEFQSKDVEAVLLVNASNAFNSLNREAALHNIQFSCPTLATTCTANQPIYSLIACPCYLGRVLPKETFLHAFLCSSYHSVDPAS